MTNKTLASAMLVSMTLLAARTADAQSAYFQAVTNLNPVGYWPMHEGGAPSAGPVETNIGTLGSLANGFYSQWNPAVSATPQYTNGVSGALVNDTDKAVSFAGNAAGYVLIPLTARATTLRAPFTLEGWANPYIGGTRNGDIISTRGMDYLTGGNNNGNVGIGLYWEQNQVFKVFIGTDTAQPAIQTGTGMTLNQWHHLAVTCDANKNFALYVDGNFVANSSQPNYTPSVNPFLIGGGLWFANGVQRTFPGAVDEVAVYTNDLSASDIAAHYNTGLSGLAGEYAAGVLASNPPIFLRMNAPAYSAPPLANWSVVTNFGLVAGNGVYSPGTSLGVVPTPTSFSGIPYGGLSGAGVAHLNGLSSFADVGFAPAYNPVGAVPFSVSAIVRGNPADQRRQVVAGRSDNSWSLWFGTGGQLLWRLGTNAASQLTTAVYNDGNWHHVVAVYTPAVVPTNPGTNAIYVDGVLAAIASNVTTNGILPGTNTSVYIGSEPNYTNNPVAFGRQLAGQVCEVAIFTNSLSASQVVGLYAAAGVAPTIRTQPVSASVNQNSAFTNTVAVIGSEPLSYQWYVNDLPRSGQTSASLILSSVQPSDAGNWYVSVTNPYGSTISATVSLAVASAPTLTQQPPNTNLTLFAGGHAVFTVAATGAQPLSYQWKSNNVTIAGATNPSLTLTNVQPGSPASYQCVVTNVAGSVSTTPVSVSVIAPPTAPYPVAVLADNPRGYWRLNEPDNGLGNGNAGVSAYDYWGGDNATYTNVSLGQAGYNTITDPTEISAQFGLSTSFFDSYAGNINGVDFVATNASASFSVEAWINGAGQSINSAGIITKGYGNGGEQFCLDWFNSGLRFFVRDAAGTAHAANSTVSPDFAWHHVVGVCDESNGAIILYVDGRLVATGTIVVGSGIRTSTGPMTIGARKSALASTFYNNQFYGVVNEVAVFGYALNAAQAQAHYTAAGTPLYFAQLPPATALLNEGAALILSGLAVGTPPLTNTWFDVTHATNVLQTVSLVTNSLSGNLTVSNVPAGWNGTTLQLSSANAYGSTNVTVSLSIIGGAPVFLQNLPPSVTTKAGRQYTYSIAVQGAEPFHYQWYSNNVPVAGETASTFTFSAATANYNVVVTNIYGPATSTVSALTALPSPTNSYATTVLGFNPAGYWPLQETIAPAPVTMETNLGTLGSLGNALYAVNNADGHGVTSGNVQFGRNGAMAGIGDTNTAIQVNGPNAVNYAFVPRISPAMTFHPPITMEVWINSSSPAFGDVMGQGGSGLNAAGNAGNFGGIRMGYGGNFGAGPNLVALIYTGSGGTFNVGGTNIETVGNSVPFSQWNHCVITYDGVNVLLYCNGTQQGSGTTPMALDTWTPFTIGTGRWQSGNGTRAYTGLIDEVAVYTNVLNAGQISNHWFAGTSAVNYKQTVLIDSPLLYYRMDSAGYSTPDPLSFPTAVNYGSAPVNAAYVSGIVPGGTTGPSIVGINNSVAAPINGIISSINAGFDSTFNPTGTQPFTVMTWFKTYPSDGVVEAIMSHGNNWAMNLDGTTGRVVLNLGTAGNVTSSMILNDGNWHFVAGVYDGTTSLLYVDGALNGSIAAGSLTGDTVNSVWLGGNAAFSVVGSTERNFAGALAHAAVFTNALSASQIQQLYVVAPPSLSLNRSGSQIVITYTGTLVSATNVTGPYTAVSGAGSPYDVPVDAAQKFYRSSNP